VNSRGSTKYASIKTDVFAERGSCSFATDNSILSLHSADLSLINHPLYLTTITECVGKSWADIIVNPKNSVDRPMALVAGMILPDYKITHFTRAEYIDQLKASITKLASLESSEKERAWWEDCATDFFGSWLRKTKDGDQVIVSFETLLSVRNAGGSF
jgi:hypothetical protein